MKRYLFLFIVALFTIVSCNETEIKAPKAPKVAVKLLNSVPATVYPGEKVDFQYALLYKGGVESAKAYADGMLIDGSEVVFSTSQDSVVYSFSYTATDIYAGNTIDFVVEASGADGAKGRTDIPLFVLASKPEVIFTYPSNLPQEFMVDGSSLEFDLIIESKSIAIKTLTTYKNEIKLEEMCAEYEDEVKIINLPFSYTPTLGDAGEPTIFTFEVMDVNGNIITSQCSILFNKQKSVELDEITGVVMGLNKCTTHGQFIDFISNKVYKAAGVGNVCADIDMALFWSGNASTVGVAIASPNASNVTSIYPEATIVNTLGGSESDIPMNWATRNETNFRAVSLSADEFAAIMTTAEIKGLYEEAEVPANDHVMFKNKAGNVLLFKINRSNIVSGEIVEKYGVLRVTQLAASNNTGTITLDYKIQK